MEGSLGLRQDVQAILTGDPAGSHMTTCACPGALVLHHIFTLPCLQGVWSPDSNSFQISENLKGKRTSQQGAPSKSKETDFH